MSFRRSESGIIFLDKKQNDKKTKILYNRTRRNDMRRPKRKFTQEQKLKIIKLVLNDKLTIRQVTDLHDIERQTIHRWINEYKQCGEKAFIDNNYITPEQEIKRLKKELREKEEEIEILKKVHAYFATQKRR